MKYYLTSNGLTNDLLTEAFLELLERPSSSARAVFVPTAANPYSDTSWVERDLEGLRLSGIGHVDILDLSQCDLAEWLPLCQDADVLWFNGGNVYFLLEWMKRSGIADELERSLFDKIYVGVSAGSMVLGPSVETNTPFFPEEDDYKSEDLAGLGLVPLAVVPHLNAPNFPEVNFGNLQEFSKLVQYPIYALDDQSAVLVDGKQIKVVSHGGYRVYNN